jgi:hypothetical protein
MILITQIHKLTQCIRRSFRRSLRQQHRSHLRLLDPHLFIFGEGIASRQLTLRFGVLEDVGVEELFVRAEGELVGAGTFGVVFEGGLVEFERVLDL